MSRRISVYVSATPDLESEREVIGEALARFTPRLSWEIRRTPHRGEQGQTALRLVADSDFALVLLGQDVTAPIGAELEEALARRVPLLALVKDVAHTPAAGFFRNTSIDDWERFADGPSLRLTVLRYLARRLAESPADYGLSLAELAALREYLRKPAAEQAAGDGEAVTGGEPAGAQEGAIIVAGSGRHRALR